MDAVASTLFRDLGPIVHPYDAARALRDCQRIVADYRRRLALHDRLASAPVDLREHTYPVPNEAGAWSTSSHENFRRGIRTL